MAARRTPARIRAAGAASAASNRSTLLLGHERLRFDLDFTWVLGGRATDEGAAGNGQPPNHNASGLWYSPTRRR